MEPVPVENQPFSVILSRFAEKVIMTYVQALIALVVVGLNDSSNFNVSFGTQAAIAALPAALTAFAALMPENPVAWSPWVATFYRAGRTYVATFVGLLLGAAQFSLDGALWKSAAIAAIPAALAVIKAAVAEHVGNTATVALLPAKLDLQSTYAEA